ncbi:MAG: hypothetical protein IJ419_16020 [Agathobacter sp.]|nr:hypothetical protein [Agathobacter sp.]
MKGNIYVHNLRLNLEHEEDMAFHRALMNYNQEFYKSKSDYHKKRLYAGIFGERDFVEEIPGVVKQKTFVSVEELKEILSAFKAEIMKEISEVVISLFMGKVFAHLPEGMFGANATKSSEEIEDEVEATACKYFDGI